MAYRWKTREPENPYMAQDGSLAPVRASGMEGYVPNSAFTPDGTGISGYYRAGDAGDQMGGYVPNVPGMQLPRGQQPAPDMSGYGASREAASQRAAIQEQIAGLQAELAGIESEIQKIDAAYPQLKNGGQEWEIAAKRAEIGDMSAYDSMMSRNGSANNQVSGIENELYNAHKLLYGLNRNNAEEQEAYANQIETALRRADEWSARNPDAKMPPIYADLRARYDEWNARRGAPQEPQDPQAPVFTVDNAEKTINSLETMVKNGTYDRATEKGYYDWVKANPNSQYAKPIREWLDANKYKTVEAKRDAEAFNARIDAMVDENIKKTPAEQKAWFDSLTDKQQKAVLKRGEWKDGYFQRKRGK